MTINPASGPSGTCSADGPLRSRPSTRSWWSRTSSEEEHLVEAVNVVVPVQVSASSGICQAGAALE